MVLMKSLKEKYFACLYNFLWNEVSSENQKNISNKKQGTEISSNGEAIISQFGHTVEMGSAPLAPDLPSIVIWATIAFMFVGGIWFKYPRRNRI